MEGYDGAIEAWIANLISCRIALYFTTIRPNMPIKEFIKY